MAIPAATHKHETPKGRFKGSLTGTLVRTLLIFTFVPLALMAGVAYFRARVLLREQAILQTENLLENQVELVAREVNIKEEALQAQLAGEDASVLIETVLHANPQSSQFRAIRDRLTNNLLSENRSQYLNSFDAFLLLDRDGVIKLASTPDWEGSSLDLSRFDFDEKQSLLQYGFAPIYDEQLILMTIVPYQTERGSTLGTLIGITEKADLNIILQPLNGLSPYAQAYFVLENDQIISANPEDRSFEVATIDPAANEQIRAELETAKTQTNPESASLEINLQNNEEVLGQLVWLPSLRTGVLLAVRSETIYNQINSLAPFTILLVLATIGSMGLVLYYGTKRVIQPLQALSSVTRKFAEGDWSQRSTVTQETEIGELSKSFNFLADQIEDSYKLLEQKVEERALQIRTAAEVAQSINTISNIDEMLRKTAELLVQRFDFHQSSIFLIDRSGKNVEFKFGYGAATKGLLERKYSLPVGSNSIIGWVAANNKPRVASDVTEDALHLTNELLPETRSEACVPVSIGDQVVGVLDVQSTQAGAFSPDAIVMLQTLASQVAAAMQTTNLVESSQVNFKELDRLYRSSRLIEEAKTESEILRVGGQILRGAPYPTLLLQCQPDRLTVLAVSDIFRKDVPESMEKMGVRANIQEVDSLLMRGTITTASTNSELPKALRDTLRNLDLLNGVFIPIKGTDSIKAILLIGSRQQNLSGAVLQPYENLADLMSVAMQRALAVSQTEKHLKEVEALASMNDLISSTSQAESFYNALHAKIQSIIGDYNLIVAIYNANDNTIHIPFSYELGRVQSIPPFPLGEGLTSILLKTRQPLMLVKDTERKAAELGAKIVGKPARSWLGAPMIVQGEVIGAMIIQDVENEGAFNEDDLKFFTTITSQVAGVVKSIQLIEETKRKAIQVEAAAEIARDINRSLNLDELLNKAVNLIRERFNFYHAGIFLMDQPGEFAVIREATGEAGAQMKRQGYKIGVGSKSIVGYVSGKGEPLIVSDTTKDMTYYPNPLLPETRAEAAIPMRVTDRVLGILDVQSTQPYAFTEDNMKSLGILADQLAIAVQNSELFAETQEHLSQHRLLHHITSSAASGTTLEEALESAVSGLQVTLGGDRVIIMLVDRDKKTLEVKASIGYAEDISKMKIEIGQGVTGWAAAHRRPLRLRDVREDPRYIETSPNTRSELAIPLIYRNEILGVINVESEQTDAYSENDEEMLGTLGGSLAAIIANARLLEQIRAQSERERLINEITAKIRRSTDIQSILHTTASEIARVTGARFTKIQVKPGVEDKDSQ